jgi:hypothetical protein
MSLNESFRYPHPLNEVASRLVAGMVALLSAAILLFDIPALLPLLVYGFAARVVHPNLSPLSLIARRVLLPALGNPQRPTPAPPKRFAQGVGLVVSMSALVLWSVLGEPQAGRVVLGLLLGFATLEAGAGFCAGCVVFNQLMRWGFVPEETCERCANLQLPAGSDA